jgi:hypothetical protein
MTPKATLTVQPITDPRTIAGARSARTGLSGCCLVISSTDVSAMRLTTDTATMATISAHRLPGPTVSSGRWRWNTKLPAAAALIHWATLKQALVGWIRWRDSDSALPRPATITTVRGGSRKIAGARTASNRSRASPWSRNWISTVEKPAAVSRTTKEATVTHDGNPVSGVRGSVSRPPAMPRAARAEVSSVTSTGTGKAPVGAFPLLPPALPAGPGNGRYSQAPYQADPGRGDPYDSSSPWPYQLDPRQLWPGQSLPYQLTRFQRWISQVERYQLEGIQGEPV